MEIEAKFIVADQQTFTQLETIAEIAAYTLLTGRRKEVHDHYRDTSGGLIMAAGYALRYRGGDAGFVITLKGLGGVEGAIHRREEFEISLPDDQSPQAWPPGPLQERVLDLIGSVYSPTAPKKISVWRCRLAIGVPRPAR